MRPVAGSALGLAALVALVLPVHSQTRVADPYQRTLPNGVSVVVREQRSAPLVAIDVWVRAGSAAEGPGEAGAAHLLEHMLFKGTAARGPGAIDFAIESLGGVLNAGTARDAAHVYTTVPAAALREALEVIADMVRHPALDAAEMERERAVVLDELARDRNVTRRIATDLAVAGACWGLPDAPPPAGTPESIAHLSREALAAFHQRNYRPSNCLVFVVGDVDAEAAANLVEKEFGDWKASADVRATEATAARGPDPARSPSSPHRLEVDSAGRRAAPDRRTGVCVALRLGGGPKVESYVALQLAAALLAFQDQGRAWDALAKLKGGNVSVEVVPALSGPILTVYGEVKAADVEAGLAALEGELARFGSGLLSQDDLETARRRLLSRRLAEMETFEGQTRCLARYALLGDASACLRFEAQLARTDAEAIRRAFASADLGALGEGIAPLPEGRVRQ